MSKSKKELLETSLKTIKKTYGVEAIRKLGENPVKDIDVIPTGSISLNDVLGIGGLPKGRIVEIYGWESSGKSSQTLHLIANAQRTGGICAIIDAEHAFDASWAKTLGVDIDELWICQPDDFETGMEVAEALIRSKALDLIVIDSVAALTPKAEIEGEMGKVVMGLHARLMSQAMRKITAAVNQSNVCCIMINQLRTAIGVMFGNPNKSTGGNALKFYASIRLECIKGSPIKEGTEVIGYRNKVKVVKNKLAAPYRTAEFDFLFECGIDYAGELLDFAVDKGVVKKAGSWFSYEGAKLGQGRTKVVQILRDNEELMVEIEDKLRNDEQKTD